MLVTGTGRWDRKAFVDAVDSRRKELGLTWGQLSIVLQVAPSTMSVLRNKGNPNVENLSRILLWLEDTDLGPYIIKDPDPEVVQPAGV